MTELQDNKAIEEPKKKKPTHKEKREKKVADQKEEAKTTVASEVSKFATPTKAQTDISAEELVKGDNYKTLASDVKTLSQQYKPTYETTAPTEKEIETAEDLRVKEKKRRWLDYVSAAAQGVSGRGMDPSKLPTEIAKAKRKEIYAPYIDAAERNKVAQDAYRKRQYEEQSAILQDEFKNAKSPEEKEEIALKLKNLGLKNKTETARAKSYYKGVNNEKTKYTDQLNSKGITYEQLQILSNTIYPETKLGSATPSNIEKVAQDFVISGEKDINTFINARKNQERSKEIDKQIESLKADIRDEESTMVNPSKTLFRDKDSRRSIEETNSEIERLNNEKAALGNTETLPPATESASTTENKSDEDKINEW